MTIFHNPDSGSGRVSADSVQEAFGRAGHEVTYRSSGGKRWKDALDDAADVIVAAGGDGTVAKVAKAICKAELDVPMAIVPLGMSNNIATHFGIDGSPEEIAAGIEKAKRTSLAIGRAKGPWGSKRFVESAGVGIFGALMHAAREAHGREGTPAERRREGLTQFRALVKSTRARPVTVTADGKDLGGNYFLVEAMNIGLMGLRLELAPDAIAGEETLVVVRCGDDERERLLEYVEARLAGDDAGLKLPAVRARRVAMSWACERGHLDDNAWPVPEDHEAGDDAEVKLKIIAKIGVLVSRADDYNR